MIKIDLLRNHQECLPRLGEIWHELLGKRWIPDVTIEQSIERFKLHLNENSLPLTYIALEENQPIGMCSLRDNDGIRPDLKPWLGSLVVDPAFQRKGIGKELIEAVQNKAKTLGFESLYLFAFDPTLQEYYSRIGWEKIGLDEYKTYPVTVMKTNF